MDRGGYPVDVPYATPQIGKVPPLSKITITFEPIMKFVMSFLDFTAVQLVFKSLQSIWPPAKTLLSVAAESLE